MHQIKTLLWLTKQFKGVWNVIPMLKKWKIKMEKSQRRNSTITPRNSTYNL